MVNYDLPWNPNRLEQRFGRIHRIGQTEVCHLWNLVAEETREGEVFKRLLEKLEEERKALGGGVFDVLGQALPRPAAARPAHRGDPLRRPARGAGPPARRRSTTSSTASAASELLEERALARDTMDATPVRQIREEMERAEARRLQPHFIAAFFLEAFKLPRRHAATSASRSATRSRTSPPPIRSRDRQIGRGEPVLDRYERITFEKELIAVPGKPLAELRLPGPPAARRDHRPRSWSATATSSSAAPSSSTRADPGDDVRVLFYLEHAIQDARTDTDGHRRVVSRQLQFVETDRDGRRRTWRATPPTSTTARSRRTERPLIAPLLEDAVAEGGPRGRVQWTTPSRTSSRRTSRRSASAARSWSTRRRPPSRTASPRRSTTGTTAPRSCKAQELAGTHAAPQLGQGPAARRRAAGAPPEAAGRARTGAPDLRPAAGRHRRRSRHPGRPARSTSRAPSTRTPRPSRPPASSSSRWTP